MHSTSDCASKFGAEAPGIVFFRQFEEKILAYKGAQDDKNALKNWI